MGSKKLYDVSNKELLRLLKSSKSDNQKRKILNEGLERSLFLENDELLSSILDPMFKTNNQKKIKNNMALVSNIIKTYSNDEISSHLCNEVSDLLSFNYFNKYVDLDSKLYDNVIKIAFDSSFLSYDSSKDYYLVPALAVCALTDDVETFKGLIDAHSIIRQEPMTLKKLEKLAIKADFSKHNLHKYHDDSFFIGLAENMLYSKEVLGNIYINSR